MGRMTYFITIDSIKKLIKNPFAYALLILSSMSYILCSYTLKFAASRKRYLRILPDTKEKHEERNYAVEDNEVSFHHKIWIC